MEYYNLQKTAEVLNITTGDVNRLREQGKLHGFRDGNDWKFKDNEIKDYLANMIKGRSKENDSYSENMSLDDDISLSDDGIFTSLLDKATEKISSSSSSNNDLLLEDPDLMLDGASDLDLAGGSGLALTGEDDIQIGGASGSSIREALSTGQDSGLSLLDDEIDFSKDELKLSGDSGLSLMDDSKGGPDLSEEETRLAELPSDGNIAGSFTLPVKDVPDAKNDELSLDFDDSSLSDNEMTVQASSGDVHDFSANQAGVPDIPAASAVPAQKDDDFLSLDMDSSDDEAPTVMVSDAIDKFNEQLNKGSDDDIFQIAPEENTSVFHNQPSSEQNETASSSSVADIFSLSSEDDDEAPTVLFTGKKDEKVKSASDSDEVFELMDDMGPKPTKQEADDFIKLAGDGLDDIKLAEEKKPAADPAQESLTEDFKLDPAIGMNDESDSESASQVIPIEDDENFFTSEEPDSGAGAADSSAGSPFGGFDSTAGGADPMGDLDGSPFGGGDASPFGGGLDGAEASPFGGGLDGGAEPNPFGGTDFQDMGPSGSDGAAGSGGESGLPMTDLPMTGRENLGGCSYAAGKGCAQASSYTLVDILLLLIPGLLLLLPTAMAAYELIRYIWSWDQPYALNGSILEFIGGLFKL